MNQGGRTGVAMGDNTTVTIYPISNYSFGSKPPKQEKDNSVGARYVPTNVPTNVRTQGGTPEAGVRPSRIHPVSHCRSGHYEIDWSG